MELRFFNPSMTQDEFFMTKEFNVIIEQDEAGYLVASVPSLPGCHTQAKSFDELIDRIKEAIELCLEVSAETNQPLKFLGIQRVAIER